MPRGKMPAATRARVTSEGGKARAAAMTADERVSVSRAGAAAVNSPAGLARRIVKKWPDMTEDERAEVAEILGPYLPVRRRRV